MEYARQPRCQEVDNMALRLQTAMGQQSWHSCCQSARPRAGCRKQHYGRAASRTTRQLAMLSWHLLLSCLRWGAHPIRASFGDSCAGCPSNWGQRL